MKTKGNIITLTDSNGYEVIIQEGESCNLVGTLQDGSSAIAKSALLTLTLSLYRESDGVILNSREDQDILDANGGTVDDSGVLTLRFDANDNVVSSSLSEGETENHIARIGWTWNDGTGTRTGKQELRFAVQKLTTIG